MALFFFYFCTFDTFFFIFILLHLITITSSKLLHVHGHALRHIYSPYCLPCRCPTAYVSSPEQLLCFTVGQLDGDCATPRQLQLEIVNIDISITQRQDLRLEMQIICQRNRDRNIQRMNAISSNDALKVPCYPGL